MNHYLKATFDRKVTAFIKHGSPICFGRLEGMKDYAEAINDTEFLSYLKDQLAEHREAMEAQTENTNG